MNLSREMSNDSSREGGNHSLLSPPVKRSSREAYKSKRSSSFIPPKNMNRMNSEKRSFASGKNNSRRDSVNQVDSLKNEMMMMKLEFRQELKDMKIAMNSIYDILKENQRRELVYH